MIIPSDNKIDLHTFYKNHLAVMLLFLMFPLLLLKPDYLNRSPERFSSNIIAAGLDSADKAQRLHPLLDTVGYNKQLMKLVHNKPDIRWPVKAPYPLPGALLPYNRIVAYYGNFLSKGMGILGELPEDEMLRNLRLEVHNWAIADSGTPVIAAIHYIAVTAQDRPGSDGMYRLRMSATGIDKALKLADSLHGIVFLDVQLGWSTLEAELPVLEPYLKLPNVHLGIDPEYDMKTGQVPCSVIGTMDAAEINYASGYLAGLVNKYHLIPKVLIVHRFTKEMVTHYKDIQLRPEVQIVMNMDGFGFPAKKRDSYRNAIEQEPVQFAGFKLFFRYDLTKSNPRIMNAKEVLALFPSPVYIQYQ